MDVIEYKKSIESVINEVKKAVVGKDDVLRKVMLTLMSNGHILIEDYPGLAKTLIAKSFSKALGCEFKRIQFTPDLLPMDILGSFIFNRESMDFKFVKGPIFTNILLADEINRAPPKTQSALLEAMQEYQVTIEGETMKLNMPFIVIATQNPIEFEGTYPLPE
ncbi:MAG: AAA family ATPase, partial [Thermoplasmata archaeon]